jgi:hypothetical protein
LSGKNDAQCARAIGSCGRHFYPAGCTKRQRHVLECLRLADAGHRIDDTNRSQEFQILVAALSFDAQAGAPLPVGKSRPLRR